MTRVPRRRCLFNATSNQLVPRRCDASASRNRRPRFDVAAPNLHNRPRRPATPAHAQTERFVKAYAEFSKPPGVTFKEAANIFEVRDSLVDEEKDFA